MTTRSRWDETRSLIEAGQQEMCPFCFGPNWCKYAGPCPTPDIDWNDIKRAEAEADRMLYGGLGTPQREEG